MIRLALAAIVLCSTLYAPPGSALPESPDARETAPSATIASAPLDCMPDDDGGEWRPTQEPAAAITESAGKWRVLHAGLVTAACSAAQAAVPLAHRPPALVAGAPAYLLHTPLLI